MAVEARVGLRDERAVEAPRAAAGLVAGNEQYGTALGIEGEGEAPFPARRAEPHLLHVRMARAVERIHPGPSELRSEPFQHAGDGVGLVLDLRVESVELRHELVEGIGTPEVSTVLGVKSSKGIGSRLRATRTEVESHGIRFEHAVVRTPGGRGAGSTWAAGPRIEHALHFLRRTRKWIGQPYDRPREPWPGAGYTGPVLVLRALLHSYEFFAIPGGIDEARAIVNDLDDPLIETPGTPHLGEVYIERVEPGDGADEVAVPSGYERHGEWIRGRYDYASIRTIPSNWSDPRYHLGVSFAEARLAERRLVLRDPVEQTIQAAIDGNREGDGLWKVLDGSKVYRYVNWMGTLKKRYAPPVDLRLRVQCEAVVEPEGRPSRQRQRILRFEPLRGEEWTGARAECRRQGFDAEGERQLLVEVRYAKDQRNPFERAAARALRRGTGRHAGISPRR